MSELLTRLTELLITRQNGSRPRFIELEGLLVITPSYCPKFNAIQLLWYRALWVVFLDPERAPRNRDPHTLAVPSGKRQKHPGRTPPPPAPHFHMCLVPDRLDTYGTF